MVVRKRYSFFSPFINISKCSVFYFYFYFIYILIFFSTDVVFYYVDQLPPTNPGFNNTPFKFTKYSNAYMLVYIRDSDKDKIICNVDEKDIAEHLRVNA